MEHGATTDEREDTRVARSAPDASEGTGETSEPAPRSLALVPATPEPLPAAPVPARVARPRTKAPARTGAVVCEALATWIEDTRAGALRRLRAEEKRRHLAGVVFVYWQGVWNKPDALLDDKREKLIADRLRENGDNVDELLYAIDGGRRSEYAKQRDGALRCLLGDRPAVEEFAGKCGDRRFSPHPRADALRRALEGAVTPDAMEVASA